MTRVRVDLPAPFSPSRATTSPPLTVRSIPRSTSFSPKRLRTPRSLRCIAGLLVHDAARQDDVGVGGELTGPDGGTRVAAALLELHVRDEGQLHTGVVES